MDDKKIYFIPGLFKPPSKEVVLVAEHDPFISLDVLREHSSLFASDGAGIPNYVSKDSQVSKIINFSDEFWNKIAKVQLQREKNEKAADKVASACVQKQREDQLKSNLDHKVDLLFNQHSFFLKKQCPVMIPYKSTLSHDEHKAYLRAFVKFRMRAPVTAADGLEFQMYMRLQNRVFEEQNSFMQFSLQVARAQLSAYNTVPDIMQNYVNEYVQHRCKRSSRYERFYVHEMQIPICPQDPTGRNNSICFTHVGHLLSLGSVKWIKLPSQHNAVKLLLDDSVSKLQPPVQDEKRDNKNTLFKTPVSEDENAKYLALRHKANIVISSGALKMLADNYGPNFDKEWDIPVKVESQQIRDADGNESSFRTIFIDKPVAKKNWTPLEKKQLFYKKSTLASLTEIKKFNFFKMKPPLVFSQEEEDQEKFTDARTRNDKRSKKYDDMFDLTSTADHDTFGVDLENYSRRREGSRKKCTTEGEQENSQSRKENQINSVEQNSNTLLSDNIIEDEKEDIKNNKKRSYIDLDSSSENVVTSNLNKNKAMAIGQGACPAKRIASNPSKLCRNTGTTKINKPIKPQETRPSGSDSGNSVLENLLSMQDSLLKPTQTNSPTVKSEKGEASPTAPNNRPWSDTLSTNWTAHTQIQNCPLWTGANVHYQLFSLGFSSSLPCQSSQPIRIIVRHNIHGLSRHKNRKMTSKAFIIYPKLENQAYFGCEVNTLSEITQQWIQLLVRPNTSLLQVRVCENTGEVMMTEEKDLAAVLKDGKQSHIGFSPQQPLATLYSVFSTMSGISTGRYLLHHDPKTNAFIQLLKSIHSDQEGHLQTFNLHSSYSTAAPFNKTYAASPWLAIDTHVLTPFHLKHYKIPATFPMDNPKKKLSQVEKKKIKAKLKNKTRFDDLDKLKESKESQEQKEDDIYSGRPRRQRKSYFSKEAEDNMY